MDEIGYGKTQLDDMVEYNIELVAENDRLREALEYYADYDKWMSNDGGEIARRALESQL